jgi:hypothetical protein
MRSVTQQKKRLVSHMDSSPRKCHRSRKGEDQAVQIGDTQKAGCRKDERQLQEPNNWGLEDLQASSAEHETQRAPEDL